MKWIKYQVVQCTVGEDDVLITKKIGYSDANLAIAQSEAYEGQYTIEEDGKTFQKTPVSIEDGGTGAGNAVDARTNLNIYSKIETDTKLSGKSETGHTHSVSNLSAGTFSSTNVKAKTGTDYSTQRIRNIAYGTTSLTTSTSALSSGDAYFTYT